MASCCTSTNGQSKNQARISLGDQLKQTKSFTFPKRSFGLKKLIYHSFQSSWFKKWTCLHYDQVNDKAFCFTCLTQGFNDGNFIEWCAQQVRQCLRELWLYQLERHHRTQERWVNFLCTSGHTFTGIVQVYSLDHTVILPR